MRIKRITTTIMLSEDVWRKAKEHGIPLSAVAELALVKILVKKYKVLPQSYYLIKLKDKVPEPLISEVLGDGGGEEGEAEAR